MPEETTQNAASTTDADLLALAAPRPWYFDGWDVFTTGPTDDTGGHRLVFPLPHETFHPSQMVSKADAELAVRAVNAYEAMLDALERVAHWQPDAPVRDSGIRDFAQRVLAEVRRA